MKKILLALLLFLPALAFADNYTANLTWNDSTAWLGTDVPTYDMRVTIGAGAPVVTSGIVPKNFTTEIVTAPATSVLFEVRGHNGNGNLTGPWTSLTLIAGAAPTTPGMPTGFSGTMMWHP